MITAQDLGALGGVAALIAVAFGIAAMGEKASKASEEGSAMRRGLADGSLQFAPCSVVMHPAGNERVTWKPAASIGLAEGGGWVSRVSVDFGDEEPPQVIRNSSHVYTTKRVADLGAKRMAAELNREERSQG